MSVVALRPSIASDRLLGVMQRLEDYAGVHISEPKAAVERALRARMAALRMKDGDEYVALFQDQSFEGRAEWMALIDELTIKDTRFFRSMPSMLCVDEYLESVCATHEPRELSFWSAGCSTGPEAYSLAMLFESRVSATPGWVQWHGVGSDVSLAAIRGAKLGVYPESARDRVPTGCRRFLNSITDGLVQVNSQLMERTHFVQSNLLMTDALPFSGFNVVFCQNVLVYFKPELRHRILDLMTANLSPGGLLVVGGGEAIGWNNNAVTKLNYPGVCAFKKTAEELTQ